MLTFLPTASTGCNSSDKDSEGFTKAINQSEELLLRYAFQTTA